MDLLRLFSVPRCLLCIILRLVSKLARISPTKNVLITNLTPHLNETMTHECISEIFLLLPRHPRQQAASDDLKYFQNSQNKVRDSYDSHLGGQKGRYVNLVSFTLVNKMPGVVNQWFPID